MNDIIFFAACGNYLFYLLYISLITHGGFFPMRGGTFSSMTNVPAHGELFIGGVMDEKCRIILHINLPSSNGGLFSYPAKPQHRAAPLHISIIRRPQYLIYTNYLFFLSFFTQEVAYAALNGRLLFWKKKKARDVFFVFAL